MNKDIEAEEKRIKKDMKALGTYKVEFGPIISRCAEMRVEYRVLVDQWHEMGCPVSEEYTNKGGAVNQRKPPIYQAIENHRRDLMSIETTLGLNPKGLKAIKQKALEVKKESALDRLLNEV